MRGEGEGNKKMILSASRANGAEFNSPVQRTGEECESKTKSAEGAS
jgi:hypothetical protein